MNPDNPAAPIALHYRRQFYQESIVVRQRRPGGPAGLVGREVAGRSFLEAFLKSSSCRRADVLVHDRDDQSALEQTLREHLKPPKQVRVKPISGVDDWARESGPRVFWEPQPIDARWTWWRERLRRDAPESVPIAMCGVTHTMATPAAARAIKDLVESPVRSFDCLICPSAAVRHTTETLIEFYADRYRRNDQPKRDLPTVETIPLGVDCQRHCPATPQQRNEMRRRLGIPVDARVVLFVGRLAHHAKANPLPIMAACQTVASRQCEPESSPQRIDLIFAGWFANDSVRRAYVSEAARVAPDVRCHFVDGRDPNFRDSVWHAADIFASLADSVQETFGLTVTEAISRSLPVLASDWNGYRDIITHGRNGFLIPTQAMSGISEDAWSSMHERSISYDSFLASASQAARVDQASLVRHLRKLIDDDELRFTMGERGREDAKTNFSWQVIMPRYEDLWQRQRESMLSVDSSDDRPSHERTSNAQRDYPKGCSPTFQQSFDRYPTQWIDEDVVITRGDSGFGDVSCLVPSPLARHGADTRLSSDAIANMLHYVETSGPVSMSAILSNAPTWFDNQKPLDRPSAIRTTIAWCLKYDLLKLKDHDQVATEPAHGSQRLDLTYALTCMGRLQHLKQSLAALVSHGCGHVVVVDYCCPDRCGDWIEQNFSRDEVTVVRAINKSKFDRSEAKNLAIRAARTDWVCLIDADILIERTFADALANRLKVGTFVRSDTIREGTGGTFIARKSDLEGVGCHDPVYQGWGEEDDDLIDALQFAEIKSRTFPGRLIRHIDHEDDLRTQYHRESDRRLSHMINRLYRAAKWDLARLTKTVLPLTARRQLYQQVHSQIRQTVNSECYANIVIDAGRMNWVPLSAGCARQLHYQIQMEDSTEPGRYAIDTPPRDRR